MAIEQRISEAAVRLLAQRGSTDFTMSDLAQEAGIARGTLYRNVESVEKLFEKVIDDVVNKVHDHIAQSLDAAGDLDPAVRLATAVRLLVRLAHETPAKGRLIVRFGLTEEALRGVLIGPPMHDVEQGMAGGRYSVDARLRLSVASLMIGAAVSAMWMVLEGHQGWREAGSGCAELLLRSLGIEDAEAQGIASKALPALLEGSGSTPIRASAK